MVRNLASALLKQVQPIGFNKQAIDPILHNLSLADFEDPSVSENEYRHEPFIGIVQRQN